MIQDDVNTIKRLAETAGGRDALVRWIKQVLPKPTGRPRGATRFRDLDAAVIEATKCAAQRCGVPVATLLRHNVAMIGPAAGASPAAAIERLQAKARRPTKNAPAGF